MKVINLRISYDFVLVDDDVYERLKHKCITLSDSRVDKKRYPVFTKQVSKNKWKRFYLHRFVMPEAKQVDHSSGDTFDCRRSNLRECNQAQNMMNTVKRKNSKTKYKGVSFTCNREKMPYRARINVNKKEIMLGYFYSEKEAALAYNEAATKHFGKFARLNEVN